MPPMNRDTDSRIRFWSKLGGLIGGGVPWVDAFALAANTVTDVPHLRAALDRIVTRMRSGEAPSDTMRDEDAFSSEVVRTIRAGEDTGDLEIKCLHIAAQLEAGTFETGQPGPSSSAADPLLTALVQDALARRATHIHIEPGTDGPGHVRLRIDGHLAAPNPIRPDEHAAMIQALRAESTETTGCFTLELDIEDRTLTLRIALADFAQGPGAVLHLEENLDPADVHILPEDLERLRSWGARGPGLVLVAGPADTAFATVVEHLAEERGKVCALTDEPIAIPSALCLPLAAASAVLAQDPDVLVLPRVPDATIARLATRAARGGRLAIAAVDTDHAPEAIGALAARGNDLPSLAAGLIGVLVPRLLPRLGAEGGDGGPRGSILALGVLEITGDLRREISLRSTPAALADVVRNAPGTTVGEAALALVAAGQVTVEDAERIAPV